MNSIEKALNDLQNAVKEELGVQTQVLSAVDAFRVLLGEQLDRIDNISTEKVEYTSKPVQTLPQHDGPAHPPHGRPRDQRRAARRRGELSLVRRVFYRLGVGGGCGLPGDHRG